MGDPKSERKPKKAEAETLPDAWERFEHAVDKALHTPPQHHKPAAKAKERPASKGRVRKGKARS